MSRYRVEHADTHLEIWVGWDNPLQTYFGQVFDDRAPVDENECVYWVGQQERELPSTGALYLAMLGWAELPGEVLRQVQADKDSSPPRTPLQEQMLRLVQRVHRAHAEPRCEPESPRC